MSTMYKVQQAASDAELSAIFALRYKVLRQPWGQAYESSFDELEANSVNLFISDESGAVIACGRLQENAGLCGQIRYMAVSPEHQGKGLGKLIVHGLEEAAGKIRLIKIELQARENAVEFYRSLGYEVKEKTFLLWGLIQHYRMEKTITRTV